MRMAYGLVGRDATSRIYRLYAPACKYPLLCRCNSSDREVFAQVFIRRQYAAVEARSSSKLVIDCGANVGYASAFFLTRFPDARVIAIEPDERNFDLLERNLAPFGDRVRPLKAAVWPHKGGLLVCKGKYRDGREWSTQVRECGNGEEPDVLAIDLGTLIAESGAARVDILKVDIEGAEAMVFATNYEPWISKVDVFAIELHDHICRQAFLHALQAEQFVFSYSGDLTIARRSDPLSGLDLEKAP
jgi:FkbM family methyltransferase